VTYCFDIDGTLCTDTNGDYPRCKPIQSRIEAVRYLHSQGHIIIIHSARSPARYRLTIDQLRSWDVPYHKLYLGKPKADAYIDDRGIKDSDFFSDSSGCRP